MTYLRDNHTPLPVDDALNTFWVCIGTQVSEAETKMLDDRRLRL